MVFVYNEWIIKMKPTYEELEKAAKDVIEDWEVTNSAGVCLLGEMGENKFVRDGRLVWNSLQTLQNLLDRK